MGILKDELCKKQEERNEKITKNKVKNSLNKSLVKTKTNLTNSRTRCKVCTKIIYRGCIGCLDCWEWFHYGCAKISTEEKARDISKTFRCKKNKDQEQILSCFETQTLDTEICGAGKGF